MAGQDLEASQRRDLGARDVMLGDCATSPPLAAPAVTIGRSPLESLRSTPPLSPPEPNPQLPSILGSLVGAQQDWLCPLRHPQSLPVSPESQACQAPTLPAGRKDPVLTPCPRHAVPALALPHSRHSHLNPALLCGGPTEPTSYSKPSGIVPLLVSLDSMLCLAPWLRGVGASLSSGFLVRSGDPGCAFQAWLCLSEGRDGTERLQSRGCEAYGLGGRGEACGQQRGSLPA